MEQILIVEDDIALNKGLCGRQVNCLKGRLSDTHNVPGDVKSLSQNGLGECNVIAISFYRFYLLSSI